MIQTTLPVQLEAGNGPDMARVTNLKAQAQHWLDLRPHLQDAAYWEENFGDYLDWMRPDGSDAITGFMTQLTVTGPYINKTLFDQAGVALPADGATWDQWVEAAKEVAASQDVPIALGWDRSGHRLAGPAISMGAKYIGEDGSRPSSTKASRKWRAVSRPGTRKERCPRKSGAESPARPTRR